MEPEKTPPKKRDIVVLMLFFIFLMLVVLYVLVMMWGQYGTTLFLLIPFTVGVVASMLTGLTKAKTLAQCMTVSGISILIISVFLLVLGREGFVCILMAIPYVFIPMTGGAFVGFLIQKYMHNKITRVSILLALFIANPASFIAELHSERFYPGIEVTTSVEIHAPEDEVWQKLLSPVDFGKSRNLFFKAGVTYPQFMQVVSENDSVLKLFCRCTNDTASYRITHFDSKNRELLFALHRTPEPMKEFSFYDSLKPKHLSGYFIVRSGFFKVVKKDSAHSLIIAKSVYSHRVWPQFYWKLWSDYLVDRMHLHVLSAIKEQLEKIPEHSTAF